MTDSPASDKPRFYDPTEHRIKSFVTRAGRTSNAQARALDTLGPQFCLPYAKAPLDLGQVFATTSTSDVQGTGSDLPQTSAASTRPVILEIGFGMGDSTAHIASIMPDHDFIGVEVHTPGVGSLLKLIGEQNLRNLRVIQHDAVEVLNHMLQPGTLAGIHIFFPDPWHKARHHKRRLIQAPLVQLLTSRLQPGGYLHLATDWENYAEQMLEVLSAEPGLQNTAQGYAERPAYRPLTKFEKRGIRLGHGVWDLVFVKRAEAPLPDQAA